MSTRRIALRSGSIELAEAGDGAPLLLLLHGNSGHKEVFAAQLDGLADMARLVAPDLLGHGASSDAADPERDYTLGGHAAYLAELLAALDPGPLVIAGVSLGGHIALELAALLPDRVRGLMLVGAPPFAKTIDGIAAAWRPGPAIQLSGKAAFSEDDVELFIAAHRLQDGPALEALRQAIRRADGRSRTALVGAMLAPEAADQQQLVAEADMPIAVVNGADDDVVDLERLEAAPYRRLWRGQPFRIAGAGHMPQVSHPQAFNALLLDFLADCRA